MSKKINLTILVSIILCVLFSCVSNKNAEVVNTPVTPPVQEETQNIQKLILEGRTTEAKELFQAKKNIGLIFRGSSNQRIIDMKKTKQAGQIVQWEGIKKDR